MFRRICGALLFLWMASATAMAIRDFDFPGGAPVATRVGIIIFGAALALVGLLMAVGRKNPPMPPTSKS